MALYLLGILAIPAAIIVGTTNLQSGRPLALLVGGAGLVVALIVMAQAAPRRSGVAASESFA